MIKRTIDYTDFTGTKRSEDYHFHMTKTEFLILEVSTGTNGLGDLIQRLIKEQDKRKIVEIFQEIVDLSIGEKSIDGERFVKNAEILAKFKSSNAYDELVFSLFTSEKAITEFIMGILPAEVLSEAGLSQKASAEDIRRLSEERLQGFNKKVQPAQQQERELPVEGSNSTPVEITQTAPPVLDTPPVQLQEGEEAFTFQAPAVPAQQQSLTDEQILAQYRQQNQQ